MKPKMVSLIYNGKLNSSVIGTPLQRDLVRMTKDLFFFQPQAKAIALTVAQAFNVAFEVWEVRDDGIHTLIFVTKKW
jgi:hypothetical protein